MPHALQMLALLCGLIVLYVLVWWVLRATKLSGTEMSEPTFIGSTEASPVRTAEVLERRKSPAETYFATHRPIQRPIIPLPDEDDNLDLDLN